MASQGSLRREIVRYLRNYTTFVAKSFDTNLELIKQYGIKYGFKEQDLILITSVAFKQKLATFRVRKVINSLIPITIVPEEAVENVLNWLLNNFNQKLNLAIKIVLQWLAGLIEYKLTNVDVIDSYYDLFYFFLSISLLEPIACKLIYLLTKPTDVSRWYVKQVLEIHMKNEKPKYSGALLYLFKSYRPDCVPEMIPAYSIVNIYNRNMLSYDLEVGFNRAREKLMYINAMPTSVDVWGVSNSMRSNLKKNAVMLIPKISQTEISENIYTDGYKSGISIKSVEDLHKYHISSSSPNRVLSLLNNCAGCHILTFTDQIMQSRFSFQLYYSLNDAFINQNPHIPETEKDRLLEKLSFCQINMQQHIPVVSRFLAEFIPRWDGSNHQQHVYRLLQWLNVASYRELHECILDYLYDIFISSSVETKCDIIRTLGELAINIIITHFCRTTKNQPFLFLDTQVEWDFHDLIKNLFESIQNFCRIGLILENDHNLLIYCITNLHEKIFLVESKLATQYWNLSIYLAYTAFFSSNPTNLINICRLLHRFPQYVPESLKNNFLDCLWKNKAFISEDPESIFQDFNVESNFFKLNLPNCNELFSLQRHFGLACYNYEFIVKHNFDDLDIFKKNAKTNFNDICKFIENFI